MAAPELNDDTVAEILLRLPPDDPAALFRAALVCKPWLRIAFNPAFLRLYRAFHRDGVPLLGFFYSHKVDNHACFVSTTAASPLPPAYGGLSTARALDCRHGRVLLRRKCSRNFVVLNPITGAWVDLQQKPNIRFASYSAVVLCAVAGCNNHGDCSGGPFLVVCVGNDIVDNAIYACVYSSKDRAWGTPVAAHIYCQRGHGGFEQKRAAVIGDAMYCTFDSGSRVLRYDLVKGRFSLIIGTPHWYLYTEGRVLMQNEDGSLGCAGVSISRLELWSRAVNRKETAPWVLRKIVQLGNLLPSTKPSSKAYLIGFAEGAGIFFIHTIAGSFTLELKSGRARKVNGPMESWAVFPFFSFFTPDSARSKLQSLVEKK